MVSFNNKSMFLMSEARKQKLANVIISNQKGQGRVKRQLPAWENIVSDDANERRSISRLYEQELNSKTPTAIIIQLKMIYWGLWRWLSPCNTCCANLNMKILSLCPQHPRTKPGVLVSPQPNTEVDSRDRGSWELFGHPSQFQFQ